MDIDKEQLLKIGLAHCVVEISRSAYTWRGVFQS